MNGPLNTVPRGLLGLFGLKGAQDGLRTLNSDVRPTIELSSWMADGNSWQFVSETLGMAAVATTRFTSSSTVPQGKAWLVRGATMQSQNPIAGDVIRFRACVQRPQSGGFYYTRVGNLGQTDPNDTPADATHGGPGLSNLGGPFLMLPGDVMACITERLIAGGGLLLVSLTALVYEFDWQS